MTTPALCDAKDPLAFGGKAVQLGEALRADLPIPPGAALSVASVEAVLAGDAAVRVLLAEVFSSLGPNLAARSSVVGEDSSLGSFAGVHATVLNVVSVAELVDAIAVIWESARSEGAIAYRA